MIIALDFIRQRWHKVILYKADDSESFIRSDAKREQQGEGEAVTDLLSYSTLRCIELKIGFRQFFK